MAATLDLHLTRQVEALVAQQLPELEKLEGLYATFLFAQEPRENQVTPKGSSLSLTEFQENFMELCEKMEELLATEYARDLILILLPTLIDIKKRGSRSS